MDFKVFCVVFAGCFLFELIHAGPMVDDKKGHINSVNSENPTIEESLLKKLNSKCSNQDISSCMMLKLVTYFNKLMKKVNIDLGEVEITQTSTEPIKVENSRSINDIEKMSEGEQLTEVLTEKAYDFVKTRSLKWRVVDGAEVVLSGGSNKDGGLNIGLSLRPTKDGVEEGRKKKNKGGDGMNAIIAAVVMKVALLKALAFKALVLLVGKALLVSKLALVLAVVIGLKKLLSSEKHVTYEVVAHPHHDHHEHIDHGHSGGGYDAHGGSGWGRNFDAQAAQNLAYSAQIPAN
ncbi:uncharacterized protein [Leptinotarsa decemlineata]|uniref:uncharacterized protein n=1 Tax=Leptinotarsa decemlineata TaxID=7539 RepID=UPI003D30B301